MQRKGFTEFETPTAQFRSSWNGEPLHTTYPVPEAVMAAAADSGTIGCDDAMCWLGEAEWLADGSAWKVVCRSQPVAEMFKNKFKYRLAKVGVQTRIGYRTQLGREILPCEYDPSPQRRLQALEAFMAQMDETGAWGTQAAGFLTQDYCQSRLAALVQQVYGQG